MVSFRKLELYKMKPLYKLTKSNKSTYFSLRLYDLKNEIQKRCSKWVDEMFVDRKDYFSNNVLTSSLKIDLDYLITKLIWVHDLAKQQKYDV